MRPTPADAERFRGCVEAQLGIHFDRRKQDMLRDVLALRCEAHGMSPSSYLAQLVADPGFDEGPLAAELTVGETYFFRNRDQFDALVEIAAGRALDIVSAGCASGEEPYSIAIALRGVSPAIRAFDINPEALRRATRARYSMWSLRETSPAACERWFVSAGKHVELADEIRNAVRFERANLLDPATWPAASCDVVFCRNVLMYFRPEVMASVVRAIAGALRPGGYLFLGHAETLRGISDDFELCHSHGTFYYARRPGRAIVRSDDSWHRSIQEASERVRELAEREEAPAAPPPDV
ncbi:MAG: methyltransferase domain-containing protein, partial [Kofleriaceae bacterium]|nr:methyltransferase domain-containing protein [Kofleriaceae bacterium]